MRRLFLGLILASTSPFFPHSAKAHGTTLHQTPTEGERVKGLIELLRPSGMGWVGSKKRVAATRFLGSHPGIAKTIFDIPYKVGDSDDFLRVQAARQLYRYNGSKSQALYHLPEIFQYLRSKGALDRATRASYGFLKRRAERGEQWAEELRKYVE